MPFAILLFLVLANGFSSFFYGFGLTVWIARVLEILLLVGIITGFNDYLNKPIFSIWFGSVLVICCVFSFFIILFFVFSTPITIKQDKQYAVKHEPKLYIPTICAEFALFENIAYVLERKIMYFTVCANSEEKTNHSKKTLTNRDINFEPKSIKPNIDKTSFEITFTRKLQYSHIYLKDTIVVLRLN